MMIGICVIFLCAMVAQAKKQKDFLFDVKQGKSIQVELPEKWDKDFLIMYVRPLQDEKKSDLGEIQLKSKEEDFKLMEFYETALFTIKSEDINLKCISAPCVGRITVISNDAIELTSKSTELILNQKQPVQVISMQLPSKYSRMVGEFKLEDDESDKIKIDVFEEKARLYGDEVQLTVAVNRKDCEKCKLLAVLSGDLNLKEEATINGQLYLYKDEEEIEINQEVFDYLFERDENTYQLKLPKQFKILQIEIFGDMLPLLKVHKKDNEYFSSREPVQFQQRGQAFHIILRREDIEGDEVTINLSQGGSLKYLMVVKLIDEPVLYNNQLVFSKIQDKGKHNYQFKTIESEQEVGIKLVYFEKGSNSIRIAECQDGCQFSDEDNHNLRFDKHELKPAVFVSPHCQNKDQEGFCRFQLEVTSDNKNIYMLTTQNDNNQRILKSDVAYTNYLEQSQEEHLILKYQKSDDDEELVFTVNTHNIVYMISRDSSCYPVRIECAKHFGGVDHLVVLRGDKLKHTQYYITLTARETTMFQFMAKVTKQAEINIKVLKEDETYRGVLQLTNGESKIHYFRVMINFNQVDSNVEVIDEEQPTIEFAIHSSRMQVALTLKKGNQLPSLQLFDLITTNNYLSIQPQDQYYQNSGNYTIGIQNMFETYLDKEIMYTFTYSTSRTVKTLHAGQQFVDRVKGLKSKYFSFYYSKNTTIFYISLQSKSNNKLTLTVQNDVKPDNYSQFAKSEDSSTLKLTESALNSLCLDGLSQDDKDDNSNVIAICQAYLIIENHGNEDILFNLNVWNPQTALELKDGQEYTFNLEYLFQETFLYYKVVSPQLDVQLHINSHYGYTRYQIYILDSQDQESNSLYAKEEYKTQHSKSIHSNAFKFCEPDCVLKILLEGQDVQYQNDRRINFDDTVFVTVTQQYMDLKSGQAIQISVDKFKPRKFIFSEINDISPQSRFKLILHEIYGKGSICLNLNDEEHIDSDKCEYEVQGNVLELTQAQLQEKLNALNLTSNPYITIQIYSIVDYSKFQLSLEISNDKNNHKLMMGVPTRIKLDIQEEVQYQYFNIQHNDDLYFKFIKVQGTSMIQISRCLDNLNKECEEETIIQEQFLAGQFYNQHIIYKNDNKKYCELCTYIIKIKTVGINVDLLIVVTSQLNFVQLPQNIAFTDFLENQTDYNIYHFSYNTDHQIEVQINQFAGDTQMWIGYNAVLDSSLYQYGPYNLIKQQKLMNTTSSSISYYQAIIPPREHLEETNYTPYANGSHTLAGHYNDDDLYIIVKNNQQSASNYSVLVTQSTTGNGQLLQDGIITFAYLSRQTPVITLYHQNSYRKQPQLVIKMVPYGVRLQGSEYFKIEVSNETDPVNFTLLTSISSRYNQQTFLLPMLEGLLTIKIHSLLEIKGNENINVEYAFNREGDIVPIRRQPFKELYYFGNNYLNRIDLQISIVSKDVLMIDEKSSQNDQIMDSLEKFYESYIPYEGELKVSITQNYDEFINRTYTASKTTIEGQLTDIILPVKQGPVFFEFSSNESVYKFTTQVYKTQDFAPYGQLVIGGDGQINYSFETYDTDFITVKFKPLKCIGCDLSQEMNSLIKYSISWGSNIQYAHVIGLCQYNWYANYHQNHSDNYEQADIGLYALNHSDQIVTNIVVSKQSRHPQLFIAIRAQVLVFNNLTINDYELYYHVAEIGMPNVSLYWYKHRFNELIIGAAIFLIVVITLSCVLCKIYRRIRKLKKENLNLQLEKKMEEAKEKVQIQTKYETLEDENNDQSNV
ncbi:unnamed protein product (macronuclear) [Paramecium tetraurelia]|uniref:Transmembrane protein n=1 Tax=Paramecium tetraurelia TaxID=5888 RepID=A0DS90_PARTE|nr:uncharacterized protein GSPATT00019611001 [Paramecium tetraurelia]CAK85907.1 unnamed protein product [Paramecium tetraurelia]|eukprot:XP_001453304.1 hypothetical protein (macronuclear) [Paramecium tetraurelia strain d4-2]